MGEATLQQLRAVLDAATEGVVLPRLPRLAKSDPEVLRVLALFRGKADRAGAMTGALQDAGVEPPAALPQWQLAWLLASTGTEGHLVSAGSSRMSKKKTKRRRKRRTNTPTRLVGPRAPSRLHQQRLPPPETRLTHSAPWENSSIW
ncbi:hypothetical protein DIPPA_29084 [Diplonema papillatum]|nr:hypothetical protein DIPPA_29084 [Diplonema papillatum]